jgi:hypothetical protein
MRDFEYDAESTISMRMGRLHALDCKASKKGVKDYTHDTRYLVHLGSFSLFIVQHKSCFCYRVVNLIMRT